ncbi:hypothetical protein [Nocardia nova]|jgi:hypothetical protein|uniref:hypothetical protein n=1 Tax=Nocardia nova TaxID=37330 RepID=UPI00189497F4|nr:hypothetical protein [Nocardia nova]MBF6144840.1 hypothetical protein [Nocardia nova]
MGADLAVEMTRLEQERSTGVLHAGDGSFHFARGEVVTADCRRTTGLGRLVVEAGVATAEDWQRAGSGDPGNLLSRPRLETLALLSVFDAAYFLLSAPAIAEFEPAPEHWLAPICHINPRLLVHECARRGDPEAGPWPAELVARTPVVPVRRVRRRRIALTGGQAEVLAAVDGRRTVADIAEELGRTSYGCLEAVRDLTLAGLVQQPVLSASAAADSAHAAAPPLVRRRRNAVSVAPPDRWESPVDVDVLFRLRAALEELA